MPLLITHDECATVQVIFEEKDRISLMVDIGHNHLTAYLTATECKLLASMLETAGKEADEYQEES